MVTCWQKVEICWQIEITKRSRKINMNEYNEHQSKSYNVKNEMCKVVKDIGLQQQPLPQQLEQQLVQQPPILLQQQPPYLAGMPVQPYDANDPILRKEIEARIRIAENEIKTVFNKAKDLEVFQKKLLLKEEYKERQKAMVDVMQIDDNGNIIVVTKNTMIMAQPRSITNMHSPNLRIWKCIDHSELCCYELVCVVGNKEVNIWLDANRINKTSYLQNKFQNAGIRFEFPPRKLKPLLLDFISRLIGENGGTTYLFAYQEGWSIIDGKYKFFGKEDAIWDNIKKRIQ